MDPYRCLIFFALLLYVSADCNSCCSQCNSCTTDECRKECDNCCTANNCQDKCTTNNCNSASCTNCCKGCNSCEGCSSCETAECRTKCTNCCTSNNGNNCQNCNSNNGNNCQNCNSNNGNNCQNCNSNNGNNCQNCNSNNCGPIKTVEGNGGGGGGSSSSNATNVLIANATSTNIINNENIVNMSINVNSNVHNNIVNKGSGGCEGGSCSTRVVTVTMKVPIVKEVCGKGCNPTLPPITPPPPCRPRPQPQPNCCIIVIPCATVGCNPHHHTCTGCQGSWGYMPVDPCGGGCFRRSTWGRSSCTMGQQVSRQVDCSYCTEDYYKTYEGYSQCHGCFHSY